MRAPFDGMKVGWVRVALKRRGGGGRVSDEMGADRKEALFVSGVFFFWLLRVLQSARLCLGCVFGSDRVLMYVCVYKGMA